MIARTGNRVARRGEKKGRTFIADLFFLRLTKGNKPRFCVATRGTTRVYILSVYARARARKEFYFRQQGCVYSYVKWSKPINDRDCDSSSSATVRMNGRCSRILEKQILSESIQFVFSHILSRRDDDGSRYRAALEGS